MLGILLPLDGLPIESYRQQSGTHKIASFITGRSNQHVSGVYLAPGSSKPTGLIPVLQLSTWFGRPGRPRTRVPRRCGHMWDSNPSVSMQRRSATVTLHGPFEKLGSFVVLPRCSRRRENLKARCGYRLNPKQSQPLFTCSWPDSNQHGISPISISN